MRAVGYYLLEDWREAQLAEVRARVHVWLAWVLVRVGEADGIGMWPGCSCQTGTCFMTCGPHCFPGSMPDFTLGQRACECASW